MVAIQASHDYATFPFYNVGISDIQPQFVDARSCHVNAEAERQPFGIAASEGDFLVSRTLLTLGDDRFDVRFRENNERGRTTEFGAQQTQRRSQILGGTAGYLVRLAQLLLNQRRNVICRLKNRLVGQMSIARGGLHLAVAQKPSETVRSHTVGMRSDSQRNTLKIRSEK